MLYGGSCIRCEMDTTGLYVAFQEFVHPRLVEWAVSRGELLNAFFVNVDTDDAVACFCKARCGHQSDVAGTKNADIH